MSLIDALLLDAEPLDVWIAIRTDGVNGSGTEDDPLDGSVRSSAGFAVSSINATGSTATAQATAHGLQTGYLVTIQGATGADATYYNGTFAVTRLDANRFSYSMWGIPSYTAAAGTITARLNPYQFDAVMRAMPRAVATLEYAGDTAKATVYGHGFTDESLVLISGAAGADGQYYNGTFQIHYKTENSFWYTMNGMPSANGTGNISCRLARSGPVSVPLLRSLPVAVRLGPGVFETRGNTPQASSTSWMMRSGMKLLGSGMDVTALKLVGAMVDNNTNDYFAISGPAEPKAVSVEVSDLTVDCNLAGQPSQSVACGAAGISGSHTRARRIRVVNFGTNTREAECFALIAVESTPIEDTADCRMEDCIAEQPAMNNARETSILCMAFLEYDSGAMRYHRGCVLRNCFVNCEFREHPVPIASITLNGLNGGVATVTTRLPHGRSNGDWVRISGAVLSGSTNNSFNGSYRIGSVTTDYQFTYTPNPAQAGSNPTGDMWVGKFPSLMVQITGFSKQNIGGNTWRITLTTLFPHFRVPGGKVGVSSILDADQSVSEVYNGWFDVADVPNITNAYSLCYEITNPSPPEIFTVYFAFINPDFHALGGDGGTATVVEGNRAINCTTGGPYHDMFNTMDQIIRNNYYRATIGPFQSLKRVSTVRVQASLTAALEGGVYVVTGTCASAHHLSAGEIVQISEADIDDYNGFFVITVPPPDSTTFKYTLGPTQPAGPSTSGYAARAWGGGRVVVENNFIELFPAQARSFPPSGILMGWTPVGGSAMRHPQAIMRRNVLLHADGIPDPEGLENLSRGIYVEAAGTVMVEENVVDLDITEPPIKYYDCRSAEFFANQSLAGTLVQGFHAVTGAKAGELSVTIADAEALL